MSTTCALKLEENCVFCHGTIRSTRRFLPKNILFTPSEVRQLPRGTHRCVVNEENQMLAVSWIDYMAVHFVSTACCFSWSLGCDPVWEKRGHSN
jgi:hypothetical protein